MNIDNQQNSNNQNRFEETASFKEYFYLIRNNLLPVLVITVTALLTAIIFAFGYKDVYQSTSSLLITKGQGNILADNFMPGLQNMATDRFILNEIEIMKSFSIRERTAQSLIDSFNRSDKKSEFISITNEEGENGAQKLLEKNKIVNLLGRIVEVQQKRGLDIVEITVESNSPYEAQLIANAYAEAYREYNLDVTRTQLTVVRRFLEKQSTDKRNDLKNAEQQLSQFQQEKEIVILDEQSKSIITQLTDLQSRRDAEKIELASSDKVLSMLKSQLNQRSPQIANYFENLADESYFKELQDGIARLQVTKDLALSQVGVGERSNPAIIREYENKIEELKRRLNDRISQLREPSTVTTPEEIRDLTQKILEEEIKNRALIISISGLENLVNNFEKKFNLLPAAAREFARFQREREAAEKLFAIIEEKYQEALINEQAQPGNVLVIDRAQFPPKPAKPNRPLIVLFGFIFGAGIAFGFVFVKNYFDTTIKNPEDIEKKNINLLVWIPRIEGLDFAEKKAIELVVARRPESGPSEAFRALRTRILLSKIGADSLKTILVTSPTQGEGKTTIICNMAVTFAQTNKKTLLIDCDFRKPRVHNVFSSVRTPGLVDYFFKKASLSEVIRDSGIENLDFIPAGTIPPNPSEILESSNMKSFLKQMKEKYDIILIDSPPIIAVTDAEVLSSIVDGSILVVSSESTQAELMEKAIGLLHGQNSFFLGTVLNNFKYKGTYGSYYKYYYYYSGSQTDKKTKEIPPAKG